MSDLTLMLIMQVASDSVNVIVGQVVDMLKAQQEQEPEKISADQSNKPTDGNEPSYTLES